MSLQPEKIAVVIGHQGDQVKRVFHAAPKVTWVRQREMRGTGDAVRTAAKAFSGFSGPTLIMCGDIPGIREETLRRLAMVHTSSKNAITLLTTEIDPPKGYGRILLDHDGTVRAIVEEKDASDDEKEITEVNTGIGMYDSKFLFASLKLLKPTNQQKEFYLTDLVQIARRAGKPVGRFRLRSMSEVIGVNDRQDLAEVARILYDEKAVALLKSGVTLEDPATSEIEPQVEIGRDTTLGASVMVRGQSRIGTQSTIGVHCEFVDSEIGANVQVGRGVYMNGVKLGKGSCVGANSSIGPSVQGEAKK